MNKKSGYRIINDAYENKGTSFTLEEREELGLRGLLPYQHRTQEVQEKKILTNLAAKETPLEKYIFLRSLENRNERLYYSLIRNNIKELMPLIYTPTVGRACKEFAEIFRHTKGFYITPEDKGQIREILNNWPYSDVRVIVVTDGERILGLGDLGSNGMGISIGKLDLYIAGGGIDPRQCLPVMLDVGTNNKKLRDNPFYLGWPHERLTGDAYMHIMEEFVYAIQDKYPKALIQFEDFATPNAYRLLERFRNAVLSFNDDIQGTAAVIVAGIKAAIRVSRTELSELKVMFLGAGSASTGIASLLIKALLAQGVPEEQARKQIIFIDEQGALVKSRKDLNDVVREYAIEAPEIGFSQAIDYFKPHALIGATGASGIFTQEILEKMAALNERPIIFPLSNPTTKAECTADQAYEWTKGKVVFASGSPFPAIKRANGKMFHPSQGNNAYIFPGLGLGAIAIEASTITDEMLLAAADKLSQMVSPELLKSGALFPPLSELTNISLEVAVAVAEKAYEKNLARTPRPADIKEHIAFQMYDPVY